MTSQTFTARSQKTANTFGAVIMARAFSERNIVHTTDTKGRKVRDVDNGSGVTEEEVIYLLSNVRALDEEELLEAIGPKNTRCMRATKVIVKSDGLYHVTAKAARFYGFSPVVKLMGGAEFRLPEPEEFA